MSPPSKHANGDFFRSLLCVIGGRGGRLRWRSGRAPPPIWAYNMMKSGDFRVYLEEHKKRDVIFDFDETISTLLADWTDRDKAVVQLFQKYDPLFPSREIRAAD